MFKILQPTTIQLIGLHVLFDIILVVALYFTSAAGGFRNTFCGGLRRSGVPRKSAARGGELKVGLPKKFKQFFLK